MRWIKYFVAAIVMAAASQSPARYLQQGFVMPAERRQTIMVVCPELFIGSRNSRYEVALDPEWTRAGYANLVATLRSGDIGRAFDLRVPECDPTAEPSTGLAEARLSVALRNTEAMFRVPQGTFPLPENNLRLLRGVPRGRYAYSIGAELAGRLKSEFGDADYALFFQVHDAYSTPGLIRERILGAFIGIPVDVPPHYGNAFLIDLRDGSLVWTHMDGAIGGDLREMESAPRRVEQLTRRFPGLAVGGARPR